MTYQETVCVEPTLRLAAPTGVARLSTLARWSRQIPFAQSHVIGEDSRSLLRERNDPPACLSRLRSIDADLHVPEVDVGILDDAQLVTTHTTIGQQGKDCLVARAEECSSVEVRERGAAQLGVDQVEFG